ncbi:MAG: hypothetical protein ACPHUD_10470, partial [Porticoccaceae bacterium]
DNSIGARVQGTSAVTLWTSSSERMRIDSSGNVGIGVTNPSNKFQVSDPSGGPIASFTNTTTADLAINLTAGVSLITPSTGILALGTSGTERMRIDSSGNVGIGTSSFSGKFEVYAGTGNSFRVIRDGDYTTEIGNFNATDGYRTTRYFSSDHIFYTATAGAGSGSEAMRIDSSGKVIIGTEPD